MDNDSTNNPFTLKSYSSNTTFFARGIMLTRQCYVRLLYNGIVSFLIGRSVGATCTVASMKLYHAI